MLIDTHAHIAQKDFDIDREAMIARAREAGVEIILAIGYSARTSADVVHLATHHAGVYAAVGIQPTDCADARPEDWKSIVDLSGVPGVVALGETGLDNYWKETPFELQQDYFDRHIRLSQERDLPFVVHMRECEEELLTMLRAARERGPISGVMHSYTGTLAGARECVELGMYISFAGMVTYKKADELREVAASIPDDRILVETDSPYLSPEPVRGKRNEPAKIVHTAARLAEVRGVSPETFAAQTTANAKRLFKLPNN